MAEGYNSSSAVTPDWLDTGDNAWQLTAATLVGLQSVPGLVILYAGISKTKWAINSAFMAFYAFAATLIVWVVYAFNMGFGNQWIPICGVPYPAIGEIFDVFERETFLAPNFNGPFRMTVPLIWDL